MRCGKKGRGEGGRWSSALREGGGMTDVGEGGPKKEQEIEMTNAEKQILRINEIRLFDMAETERQRDEEDFAAPGRRLTSSNGV
ncbi:hypothetical protein HZH68_000755 [Vespula germanica]|uniref:Uncharacterized protein n=1 Tax=Vespula germanica TaxID=30212 RepID=A0A834NU79_VESGE|nr:hypothetical protein HZH68_000755 [Vespula germanica]